MLWGEKSPLLLLISINTLSGGAKLVANQTLADSFSFPLQDWRDDPLGLSLSVDLLRGLLYSCSSTEQRPKSRSYSLKSYLYVFTQQMPRKPGTWGSQDKEDSAVNEYKDLFWSNENVSELEVGAAQHGKLTKCR